MKPHFGKQITESPRRGGSWGLGRVAKLAKGRVGTRSADPEAGEEFASRTHAGKGRGTKEFTDVLGPLRRFLFSAVGRPWDDVFAEISEALPATGLQGRHIREHVDHYVERNAFLVDGVAYHRDRWNGMLVALESRAPAPSKFFVHPETGKLEVVRAQRGLVRTPDGRRLKLVTWARRHFGKSTGEIRAILALGKGSDGAPPSEREIEAAINKAGVVDELGCLRARPAGSWAQQRAADRRAERVVAAAKEVAAKQALLEAKRRLKANKAPRR